MAAAELDWEIGLPETARLEAVAKKAAKAKLEPKRSKATDGSSIVRTPPFRGLH